MKIYVIKDIDDGCISGIYFNEEAAVEYKNSTGDDYAEVFEFHTEDEPSDAKA